MSGVGITPFMGPLVILDKEELVRARSLYSTVDESSDVLKSCPTRKKTDFSVFFLFFPPTCQKSHRIFFIQSVVFLSKIPAICPTRKTNRDLSFYFFTCFYLRQSTKTPCRDPSTVEYSECALMSTLMHIE